MPRRYALNIDTALNELNIFFNGWSWHDIATLWKDILENNFNIKTESLFAEIILYAPENSTDSHLVWWQNSQVSKLHDRCQRELDELKKNDNSNYSIDRITRRIDRILYPHSDSTYYKIGPKDTLHYLWENRENSSKIAAIMIAGSLFPWSGDRSNRHPGYYPENLPCPELIRELYKRALVAWQDGKTYSPWHQSCTKVLPSSSYRNFTQIKKLEELIRYLAEDHAAIFSRNQPVAVIYSEVRNPDVDRRLQAEYEREKIEFEKQARERIELTKRNEEQSREEALRIAEIKKIHSRWGEWNGISEIELKQLVWSMPTTHIATMFGISDVAIGKRCKTLGIKKPPAGFWRRVETGQIPHPRGKPVDI